MNVIQLVMCLSLMTSGSATALACAQGEEHGPADKSKWKEYKKQRQLKKVKGKDQAPSEGEVLNKTSNVPDNSDATPKAGVDQ